MKTCATCKHWEKNKYHQQPGEIGICRAVLTFWDSTKWADNGMGREWTDEGKKATAFAQDGSDYKAYLLTKPEHGCTMHEEATK